MSISKRSTTIIGVTGGIACGKSETGNILHRMGWVVWDADHVAHRLMRTGTPVFENLIALFGPQILNGHGEISRPVLGKMVFEDAAKRDSLNNYVHPAVRKEFAKWIARNRVDNRCAAGLVPLLFESGMDDLDWDAVICVSADEKKVYERLEKRGISHADAEKRIHAQMDVSEKIKRADYTLSNNGSLSELKINLRNVLKNIEAEEGTYE